MARLLGSQVAQPSGISGRLLEPWRALAESSRGQLSTGDRRSRQSRASLIALLLAVAASLLIAGWIARTRVNSVSDLAALAIAPQDLDFGTVWSQDHFRWTLPVKNISDHRVDVEDVRTYCACTDAQPKTFTLSPGQSQIVTLDLDLRPRENDPRDWRTPFETTVEFVRRDILPSHPSSYAVRGTVLHPIDGPLLITYYGPDEIISGAQAREKSVTFQLHPELSGIEVRSGEFEGIVQLTRGQGGMCSLSVRPDSTLPVGEFHFRIPLVPQRADGKRLPATALAVDGRVVHDICTAPEIVRFPPTAVGGVATTEIQVRSRTGEPIIVDEASSSTLDVVTTAVDAAGGPTFALSKHVSTLGSTVDNVSFLVRTATDDQVRLTVPVAGYGIHAGER